MGENAIEAKDAARDLLDERAHGQPFVDAALTAHMAKLTNQGRITVRTLAHDSSLAAHSQSLLCACNSVGSCR